MTAGPPAAFRVAGVRVVFGRTVALDGVDLVVRPGEAVAFVGPSGSGKSTLLRCLNGTARPTEGTVEADGRSVCSLTRAELRRFRASVGFVHQDLALVPNLRVSQNVLAGRLGRQGLLASLRSLAWPSRAEVARVHELLARVGIEEKLFERTDRLSGGQRQRVAVARALYQGPRALLADEPVSSVDPARARDLVALLLRVAREERLTLCMSLHNLDLAREHFPRLVGLRRGRIAFDHAAAEVSDADFHALYDLTPEEILGDGA